MLQGNVAIAEGAICANCRFYFGYPITPQNDIPEYLSRELPKVGGTFIQAESEIASINMVMGAGATGVRAMTSSSGPGISLKQEGVSYMASSEIPGVIAYIGRIGPGLGGIAPTQGDYKQITHGGGHGDYHSIVLAPNSVQEMFDLTIRAFELADKYRTPAYIYADALLGQMKEPVEVIERNQITIPQKPWALTGCEGREPHILKSLRLEDKENEDFNWKLYHKYEDIKKHEVMSEAEMVEDAEVLVVAFGIVSRVCETAIDLAREEGLKVGLLRPITIFPFPSQALEELTKKIKKVLVVEMNTGQMLYDVKLAADKEADVYFHGRPGGGIPTPQEVLGQIEDVIKK